ncbi:MULTISPECIES: hypothetical protein [unclassified Janthinobacterium]|uniref:hypothetical protein n=1 Tax=unclassified Janthinobacterium TaxID=2610881 RepID=UPI0027126CBF|nr:MULTISPECIES: hypothetical protein [unclassified Janthinobacterium]MDO8066238.1 hypothetical protein [Janthinobacterium sp. SUN206]MDO8072463.1 hypothetical protein [Janthinobacterium sp. SUN176]
MNCRRAGILSACALISLAQSAEIDLKMAEAKALSGRYQVYGGSLAEMLPPTPNDRHVSFRFKGQAARDLFNGIGPDVRRELACSGDPDFRERRRGHLLCVHNKDNGYACLLGLDLRTGKSEAGGIC